MSNFVARKYPPQEGVLNHENGPDHPCNHFSISDLLIVDIPTRYQSLGCWSENC